MYRVWDELLKMPVKGTKGSRTFAPTAKEREVKRLNAVKRMKKREEILLKEEEMKVQKMKRRLRRLSELTGVKYIS